MPAAEFEAALAEADLVIAHSGVGSALSALEAGRSPILVPRRVARSEHVDDHQVQVARALSGRGLAVHAELEQLDRDLLWTASARSIVPARQVLDLCLAA
jgi:UDP-N-acetylglucosamine transferase subunit ALG13